VPMYGEGPGNCFEGMTTLAALATATTRIRLGLLVTGVTYRHPSVLAAQAVTVDHASGGRLEFALGAAWFEPEHRQLGIAFPPTPERFDLLEDELEIVTRLFSGEVVSYRGKHLQLEEAQLRPPSGGDRHHRSSPRSCGDARRTDGFGGSCCRRLPLRYPSASLRQSPSNGWLSRVAIRARSSNGSRWNCPATRFLSSGWNRLLSSLAMRSCQSSGQRCPRHCGCH